MKNRQSVVARNLCKARGERGFEKKSGISNLTLFLQHENYGTYWTQAPINMVTTVDHVGSSVGCTFVGDSFVDFLLL